MLPTARHRCDISSNGAVLPGRNDAEMDSQTRYTVGCQRNTASTMKDLLDINSDDLHGSFLILVRVLT